MSDISFKNFFNKPLALLIISLLLFFYFGFYHLTDFITSDDGYWYGMGKIQRIGNYWQAVKNHDWEKTFINDKPGITLAYASGLALLLDRNPAEQIKFNDKTVRIYDPQVTKRMNFIYRVPILLISGLFSFYFFWIFKKITGDAWIALFAATIILLSPIVIGMSQIVNPDALFWLFASAVIFTFLAYLVGGEKKLVALATLFFGLAMASKYVAAITIPFVLFMIMAYYFLEWPKWENDPAGLRQKIINNLLAHLVVIFGGYLILSLMMPAVFYDYKYFIQNTVGYRGLVVLLGSVVSGNLLLLASAYFNKGRLILYLFRKAQPLRRYLPSVLYSILLASMTFVLINWILRHALVDFSNIPFDMKLKDKFATYPFLKKYFAELVPITFSLTPLTIFLVFYLWVKGIFGEIKHKVPVFIISSLILFFILACITEGMLLQIRYSMLLYPLMLFLAGISVAEMFFKKTEEVSLKKSYASRLFLFVIFMIIITLSISFLMDKNILDQDDAVGYYKRNIIPLSAILIGIAALLAHISARLIPWRIIMKVGKKEAVYLAIIFISLISIWKIKPFYFNYTNDLLSKKYIITAAWGYGGYEGAQYLNSLPDAENLTLWTDSYGICEFFVGRCIMKSEFDTGQYKVDYYYRTLRGQISPKFPHPMEEDPIWILKIDGRPKNFVKLYKALDL